jgi:hypothetical protein
VSNYYVCCRDEGIENEEDFPISGAFRNEAWEIGRISRNSLLGIIEHIISVLPFPSHPLEGSAH